MTEETRTKMTPEIADALVEDFIKWQIARDAVAKGEATPTQSTFYRNCSTIAGRPAWISKLTAEESLMFEEAVKRRIKKDMTGETLESETEKLFEPLYNHLTGEELKPGQVVSPAHGAVPAFYSSVSRESFNVWKHNRKKSIECRRTGEDGREIVMHVTQAEWDEIEKKDNRWKKI